VANNASIGAVSTCRMVRFAQGRKNGAKVVALDPRCSETAAKADATYHRGAANRHPSQIPAPPSGARESRPPFPTARKAN
jgi:hypothetical protein